jgi:four helix bundle protein
VADFKKLLVWQKAQILAVAASQALRGLRGNYTATIRSKIQKTSAAIPDLIAQGRANDSEADFARFIRKAIASASILESQLILARDLKLLSVSKSVTLLAQTVEVRKCCMVS